MKQFKFGLGIFLVFIVLGLGAVISSRLHTANADTVGTVGAVGAVSVKATHVPDPSSMFQGGTSYPDGVPAITPHVSSDNVAGAAFSQQDVTNFINAHGFPAGKPTDGTPLKATSIQFITAKQASDLMKGESIGRPDDALVCYVKLQGPFSLGAVSVPPGVTTTGNAPSGKMVFDATTGNLLVWGLDP
jgi:hypothetical protein